MLMKNTGSNYEYHFTVLYKYNESYSLKNEMRYLYFIKELCDSGKRCTCTFRMAMFARGKRKEVGRWGWGCDIMRAVYRGTSELLRQNLPAYLHSPGSSTDGN